jgi:Protein of unknown function (DUF1761)
MHPYLAIFIAGLIPMVVGFIWYHPKAFGGAWMKSIGMTEEELTKGNMPLIYGTATLLAFFLAWRINGYAGHSEPGWSQLLHGFFHGAWSTGAPAAVVLTMNGLFERRSATNLLINALYWIVTLGLVGAFLYSVATPDAVVG